MAREVLTKPLDVNGIILAGEAAMGEAIMAFAWDPDDGHVFP